MAEEILKDYVEQFGGRPRTANELLQFAKKKGKNLLYGDAKKLVDGSKGTIKEKNSGQQYAIGDLVLMTKDRHATIRYIGPVPEMGDTNVYYGVELMDGTVGQHDGSIRGKRYFQTDGQRAMFIPIEKIRRIMTAKDHKRHDSYSKLHSSVTSVKDQYQGNFNGVENTNKNENENQNANEVPNEHEYKDPNDIKSDIADELDILSVVEVAPKGNEKTNNEQSIIQSLAEAEEKQEAKEQNEENNNNNDEHKHKKSQSRGSIDKGNINNNNNNVSSNTERKRSSQTKIQEQPKSNNNEDTFQFVNFNETILHYALHQTNETIRNQLFDLYCNPITHNLLTDAFNEIKTINDYNKQKIVWALLFKRWQKYL